MTIRELNGLNISPRASALAGIIGPVVFVTVYTVFGLATPGYSPLTQVISNLELAPYGWIQQLNFLQCGTLIIIFAVGFHGAMPEARPSSGRRRSGWNRTQRVCCYSAFA
ncbi:MAG: DUF998 domain-containing protein [Thaumarchaeota archaeon]|nr:MAG: DUF998 domain-containing protein [Nitrososphaerota archaeon]